MDPNESENPERLQELLRQIEAQKAELEARLRAASIRTEGGAAISGNVNTGGGDLVGRDKHEYHYHSLTSIDLTQAEATYRRCIADRCKDLPLQDVGDSPTGGESEPLSLAEVYIGLDTRRNAPVEAIDHALANVAQGRFDGLALLQSAELLPTRDDAKTRAVSALEAAILNQHLVLTGEPGSGKSTFIDHLTQALALQRWECLPGWPERERNALPIARIRPLAGGTEKTGPGWRASGVGLYS